MYARVWKFNVLPEKIDEFAVACRAVGAVNRKRQDFRGFVVVRGGPKHAPEATVVSVWDTLEALRASESEAFQESVARAIACCSPGTALQEEDVIICDFKPVQKAPVRTAAKKKKKQIKRRKGK